MLGRADIYISPAIVFKMNTMKGPLVKGGIHVPVRYISTNAIFIHVLKALKSAIVRISKDGLYFVAGVFLYTLKCRHKLGLVIAVGGHIAIRDDLMGLTASNLGIVIGVKIALFSFHDWPVSIRQVQSFYRSILIQDLNGIAYFFA